jgi:hypothetical protein
MGLRGKIALRVFGFAVVLIAVATLAMFLVIRYVSTKAVRGEADTVSESMKMGLNAYMLLGAMDKRDFFLDAMAHLGKDIKDAYVVRGEPAIRQFGPPRDKEKPRDRLDELVLKEGKPVEVIKEGLGSVEYRRTVPLIAKDYGNINCMTCHVVKEGEVLGAITVKLDITGLQSYALRVGTLALSVLIGITLLMLFYIYLFFNKYIDILSRLKESMKSLAKVGFFSEACH